MQALRERYMLHATHVEFVVVAQRRRSVDTRRWLDNLGIHVNCNKIIVNILLVVACVEKINITTNMLTF